MIHTGSKKKSHTTSAAIFSDNDNTVDVDAQLNSDIDENEDEDEKPKADLRGVSLDAIAKFTDYCRRL